MIVLGLDAGFSLPGYAVVDTVENTVLCCGGISTARTSKKERKNQPNFYVSHDDARRVTHIFAELKQIVNRYKPTVACVELPIGAGRSSAAVKGMAYAAAISAVLVYDCELEPVWITPRQNKLASTGIADAEKEQVWEGVQRRFANVSWPRNRRGDYDRLTCWAIADALSTIMYYEAL